MAELCAYRSPDPRRGRWESALSPADARRAAPSRALLIAVARFLRRELEPAPHVLVGLHRLLVDPRRVARLLAAHRRGAGLARHLTVDERAPQRALDDPRFDWGELRVVPAPTPLAGAVLERPRDPTHAEDGLPTPLREQIGALTYYAQRHADFLRRHASAAPDYYLGYGAKYVGRFALLVRPQLSAAGQAWVDRALVLLQAAIEDALAADRARFDRLEQDAAAFRRFAYATHPRAYLEAGLRDLPVSDLAIIARAPDAADLQSSDGIEQVLATASSLVPAWEHALVQAAANGFR